jgi:hypothetical protein
MNVPEGQDPAPHHGDPSDEGATSASTSSQPFVERSGSEHSTGTSLRDLLNGYDNEVEASLREVRSSTTGLQRVRLLHRTRRSIAVHDAVLGSALCPLLEELPGGPAIADRLRQGCQERAELLSRFAAAIKGVAAHNVYPVSGEEIEEILEGLELSFDRHVHDETAEVSAALEAAAGIVDPEVLAARMALEALEAPTRAHSVAAKHPRSSMLKGLYRYRDRLADWQDAHHGWLDPQSTQQSPRALQVQELKQKASGASPTVRDVLAGYDQTVVALIEELGAARTDEAKAEAARRLNAAITVHDSVLGGVLCPLLEAVPSGKDRAAQLREGCHQRAELLHAWNALTDRVATEDLYRQHSPEVEEIIASLIESFHAHEQIETSEVTELLKQLPSSAYRTKATSFGDAMTPWRNEGPELLALRMALWAHSSPTRTHRALVKHPSSRTVRSLYHLVDHWLDFWGDTPLERWFRPNQPPAPFSDDRPGSDREGAATS